MFEAILKTKANQRTERTQVEVADSAVAVKYAERIDASLKSLLSGQRYAEALKAALKPSVFGSKDIRLAACAGYLIAKLKKSDEALAFIACVSNNNLRTSLYRTTMLGITRQIYNNYVKSTGARGSTANLAQEVYKKLDGVVDKISNIQNSKDRDVAYESFVIAGRFELNNAGVHAKLLSIAENVEDQARHDKLVAWFLLSTANLPEVLNQGLTNVRDSEQRDLLLIDLGVKLSENVSSFHSEKSAIPLAIHLLEQSHPYDVKIIEYRDAALEEIIFNLLNSEKTTRQRGHRSYNSEYVPTCLTLLLSKIHSESVRERAVKEILSNFKAKYREARREYNEIKREYLYSRYFREEAEKDFAEFVKSLQTVLRSIIGEGLIANRKLIEQIESEMSSGLFSRGGLAA